MHLEIAVIFSLKVTYDVWLVTISSFPHIHLCTDVFGKPLSAFAILSTAQLSKASFLFLVKVLPVKTWSLPY